MGAIADQFAYIRRRHFLAILHKAIYDAVPDVRQIDKQEMNKAMEEAAGQLGRLFDSQQEFTLAQAAAFEQATNELRLALAKADKRVEVSHAKN